jgi:FtsP/CotA-like multicopper oxidase with cupredoxin domain
MNGRFKGPILTADKGDRFEVNVTNRITSRDIGRTTSVVRLSRSMNPLSY